MPPAIQDDSFVSSVFSNLDISTDDDTFDTFGNSSWTHFHNEGNAFRSNLETKHKKKKKILNTRKTTTPSSSPNTTQTWASSTFEDSFAEPSSFSSSPLHTTNNTTTTAANITGRNSPSFATKKPMTREEEQKVQQLLVHAIRKEYQDVNTDAAQRKVVHHLSKLQRKRLLSYNSKREEEQATYNIMANHMDSCNNSQYSKPKQEPKVESQAKEEEEDPFDLNDNIDDEDEDTQKPISFLNTSNDEIFFSDDDTLTLSLYSEDDPSSEERVAERIHILKESVLAILNCTLCSNPTALLTGNYEGRNVLNISKEEMHRTVQESIDLQHDEIHL